MIKEFRDFIARGNVMDLAVGIIIGAAFTAIVNSLVNDLINPLIGAVVGGLDFSNYQYTFGTGEGAATLPLRRLPDRGHQLPDYRLGRLPAREGGEQGPLRGRHLREGARRAQGADQEEVLIEIRDLLKARTEALPPPAAPPLV